MDNEDSVTLYGLAERYYADGDGTRKPLTYFLSYQRLLAGRRHEHLRILELGVSSGASLLSWRDYLPNATIVGIDISSPPPRILNQDRIHFLQGSQDDPKMLDLAAATAGGSFDLIVDDASHIGYLTKRSLHYLFPRWLVPGGYYVIEDFGTGYLPEYPDGQLFESPDWRDAVPNTAQFTSSQYGMVGVVKQIIDHLMQELMTRERHYLSIERLIIETNIVFIEKSAQPGSSPPEMSQFIANPSPSSPARRAAPRLAGVSDLAGLSEVVENQAQRIEQLEQIFAVIPVPPRQVAARIASLIETVDVQAERIGQLERVIARLRNVLSPLLWLRRSIRGAVHLN